MISRTAARETGRVVRLTTVGCIALACLVVVGLSIAGRPAAGAFVAAGIVVGATNAHMAQRLVNLGVPFAATSLLRIMAMTAAAAVIGLIGGFGSVFLVIAGVGVAQLVMAGSALVELNRR